MKKKAWNKLNLKPLLLFLFQTGFNFFYLLSFTANADVVEMDWMRWLMLGILLPNRNKQFKAIFFRKNSSGWKIV